MEPRSLADLERELAELQEQLDYFRRPGSSALRRREGELLREVARLRAEALGAVPPSEEPWVRAILRILAHADGKAFTAGVLLIPMVRDLLRAEYKRGRRNAQKGGKE